MDNPVTTEVQSTSQNSLSYRWLARHLKPSSAARLLGISLDNKDVCEHHPNEAIGELLESHLDCVWYLDEGRQRIWPKLVRQVPRRNGSPAQATIGELLLDQQTKLSTIKQIRDRAKAQVVRASSEAEQAVMTTIYFAAIANGLVHRRMKITTCSYASLELSFEKLIRKAWMPAGLANLFRQAAELCRQQ